MNDQGQHAHCSMLQCIDWISHVSNHEQGIEAGMPTRYRAECCKHICPSHFLVAMSQLQERLLTTSALAANVQMGKRGLHAKGGLH